MIRISRRQALKAAAAGLAAGVVLARTTTPSRANAGLSGTVYTANEHGNSMSAIDLASGQVVTIASRTKTAGVRSRLVMNFGSIARDAGKSN